MINNCVSSLICSWYLTILLMCVTVWKKPLKSPAQSDQNFQEVLTHPNPHSPANYILLVALMALADEVWAWSKKSSRADAAVLSEIRCCLS